MSGVCNGCADRRIVCTPEFKYNCHDHCERYANEVREHRELAQKRLDGKVLDKAYGDYIAEKSYRLKAKYGRGR